MRGWYLNSRAGLRAAYRDFAMRNISCYTNVAQKYTAPLSTKCNGLDIE
jgi:hypothetical protein